MVRVTLVVRFMVLVLVWSQPGASSPWWPGPHKPAITTSTPTPAPTPTPSMPGQCTVVRTVNNTTRYGFLCNMCQTTTYNCPVEVSVPCSSTPTPTPTPYPTPTWQPTTIAPYSTTGWWSWGGRGKRWVEWWPQGNSRTTTPSPTTGYYTSSPYTDDWWPGQGGPAGPACKSYVQRTINDVKCQIMCCNGDEVDPNTGSCNQASEVTCMNGGSVMGHTKTCVCPKGFRGSRCQHRACSIMCQNGGVCKTNGTGPLSDVTYNEDYCVCPEDTTGFFCETTLCPLCQNNATCHTGFGFATCRCQEGFSGIYCESPDRSGSCPESAGTCQLQHPIFKSSVCTKDAECPGKQKCCPFCGTRLGHCVDPVFDQTTCRYNNKTIAVNSTFYPDPCRVCTCNTSHGSMPHGVVECTFIACPQLVPNCRKALHPPDKCCPECADTPDSRFCGASYKPPRFLNCPEELVVLDVDKNSDTAKVSLDLKAVDCNGKNLSVELSDKWVKAGKGEENFLLVSATSQRDANGNFSTCIFHVRVRDTQPPKFVTCPVDFVQPDSGPVTWQVPIATDNVGLAVPPTSRLSPGIRLKSGSHVVLYWAEDYQGNVARCTFLVTVGSNSGELDGTDEYTGGAGGHGRVGDYHKSEGGNSLGIAFGVIGGLLLLLIPAVIYLLCKRRRNSARLDLTAPTLAMAAANGVAYAVSNGVTSGLPRYTLNAGPDDIMIAPPQYPGPRSVDDVRGAVGGQEADVLPAKNPLS